MTGIDKLARDGLSRRTALVGAVACVAGPLLVATRAAATPKVSQDCVHFSKVASGEHRCGSCRLFQAPSDCLVVQGPVSANCSCRIWLPKTA